MASPDWSDLPTELLQEIAGCLRSSRLDIIRFRSVCGSWRSSAAPYLPSRHDFTHYITVYSIQPFSDAGATPWFPGILHSDTGKGFIMDLLSKNTGDIFGKETAGSLPKVLNLQDFRVEEIRKVYVLKTSGIQLTKVVVSGITFLTIDFRGKLLVLRWIDGRLSVITIIMKEEDFCDVAFRGGKFYAFTCRGLVITVDPDSLNINRVVPTEKPVREIGFPYHEFLVVESHGDLFSVCASEDRKHVVRIEVKRLDEGQHQWVDVKDELKDHVLFVGDICRFSVSAKDYPGYKANCVYFFNYYGRSRQPQPYCHHQDTHFLILDVEDGQARRFCNHSGCSHYFSTLPTWLSEKPSYLNLALQEAFISKCSLY
ncbi:hypothetical protein Tsubulata_035333 [Turnera subulata]|uniref:F-box domain-containing protein n=1 Tax=Turnera subulata TaxID=218843 RepID=A0A9Q0FQK1_9ROSI|nr:hypothetical protein Tsubulata_035333 [Turnera subulata]